MTTLDLLHIAFHMYFAWMHQTLAKSREALNATNRDCDASEALFEWQKENPNVPENHPELNRLKTEREIAREEWYRTHPYPK